MIDVDKCITLYNEIDGDFPSWAEKNVHNSLMGCWKCQEYCIGNMEIANIFIHLDDLIETETEMIISQKIEANYVEIICEKLKMFTPDNIESMLPIISRNLKVLLN